MHSFSHTQAHTHECFISLSHACMQCFGLVHLKPFKQIFYFSLWENTILYFVALHFCRFSFGCREITRWFYFSSLKESPFSCTTICRMNSAVYTDSIGHIAFDIHGVCAVYTRGSTIQGKNVCCFMEYANNFLHENKSRWKLRRVWN